MPRNASVTLGAHHEAFIESQIKTTGYCSGARLSARGSPFWKSTNPGFRL